MTGNDKLLLTGNSLKLLYERMDNTDQGSFWVELSHMERNGFDIARQKQVLRHFFKAVVTELGFAPELLTEQQERNIALQVRRQLRQEAKMAPLSASEEAAWTYEIPPWSRRPICSGDEREFDTVDVKRVADWIFANDPELAEYIRSVTRYNCPLGFNGGPNDRLIIRAAWADGAIMGVTARLFGPDCPRNVDRIWRKVWDIIAEGTGA